MQISLFGPFISQDSEKLRFQKPGKPQSTKVFSNISRILCPAPEGGAVSQRSIATPIRPSVRVFPSHLSIRPDSPYFGDAFYAFQTLLEALLTGAIAFRVSTMHRAPLAKLVVIH